jgi:hypothetical protein
MTLGTFCFLKVKQASCQQSHFEGKNSAKTLAGCLGWYSEKNFLRSSYDYSQAGVFYF